MRWSQHCSTKDPEMGIGKDESGREGKEVGCRKSNLTIQHFAHVNENSLIDLHYSV